MLVVAAAAFSRGYRCGLSRMLSAEVVDPLLVLVPDSEGASKLYGTGSLHDFLQALVKWTYESEKVG